MNPVLGLGQDLELAVRSLLKRPKFAAVAIVSLALGIGANAAVFSLIDAVLFKPFPVENPDALVTIQTRTEGEDQPDAPSIPDFRDFQALTDVFTGLAGHGGFQFSVRAAESTERSSGELVSASYFDVLGVAPTLGRGFTAGEDEAPQPIVVISHRFWRRAFGGSSDVLGKPLIVNGRPLTIVGVAPVSFLGIDVGREHDLWIPFSMLETLWPRVAEFLGRRGQSGLTVTGRLRPGVTFEEADAALRTTARQLAQAYPDTNGDKTSSVIPLNRARVSDRGQAVSYFTVLSSVAALVFLIACANVASLRTVELSGRDGELAMRTALGATRLRLARQLLVENAVLYGIALVASLGVAVVSARLLEQLTLFRVPLDLDLTLDHRVVLFAAALAVVASVLFTAVHVLRAKTIDLPGRAHALGAASSRLLGGLVVVQIALSSALLVGTGLLGRTLQKAYAVDPGYRLEDVLFVSVDLQSMAFRYDEGRTQRFFEDVLERVEAIPGVHRAAWSADIPFERMTIRTLFVPDHHESFASAEPDWLQGDADIITPGYLQAMGIPLLRGREFTDRDDASAPGVVLVNETMARTHWPGEDALGRRIRVWGRQGIHHETYEIVGIVRDVRYATLFGEPGPYVYYPVAQRFFQNMNLHVHVAGDPVQFIPAVREAFRAIDDDLPIFDARALGQERSISLSRQTTAATLLGLSGLLALFLTTLGTYSVSAYVVSRRTPEIGLRMALGAAGNDIRRFILRQGGPRIVAGLAAGLAGAALVSSRVESLLLGVSRFDAAAYVAAIGCLGAAAVLACWVPARRAAKIDPAIALRHEN